MKLLYDISIQIYDLLIFIAGLFGNKKAQLIYKGRKHTHSKITEFRNTYKGKIAWFHCASLGEFEQARPLIEAFRIKYTEYKVALSFYSPSGYEIRKNYTGADLIIYLPSDTQEHAGSFIGSLNPSIIFFIKYEFWLNFLDEIKKRNIPLFLVSGIFRPSMPFFKRTGDFMRLRLKTFSHFFLQNDPSGELLNTIDVTNWSISDDTRFDRVQLTAQNKSEIKEIAEFKQDTPLLVIGSAWKEDMNTLVPFINTFSEPLKIIIAPHEIHSEEIHTFQSRITKKSDVYSSYKLNTKVSIDVLFIDNIGMLSSIYAYADYAYIGGAFKSGLHNILEPAVFGPAVFFGPKIKKFPEAAWMISLGYAFSISNTKEFSKLFRKIY